MDSESQIQTAMWDRANDGASTSRSFPTNGGPPGSQPDQATHYDEAQSEPECWQLGGSSTFAALASAQTKVENGQGAPLRRRGRPPGYSKAMPQKSALPTKKGPRRTKSRKKRLTMTKGSGSNFAKRIAVKATPATTTPASVPTTVLSETERSLRIDHLLENCPDDLALGLREASAVVQKMKSEADIFRDMVRQHARTGQALDNLSEQLKEDGKVRQAQQDARDVTLSGALCDSFSAVHLAVDAEQTIFSDGMTDAKVQLLRGFLGLPQLLVKSASGKGAKWSVNRMDFQEESEQSVQLKKELDSDFGRVENDLNLQNGAPVRRVCDFSKRTHPKDLSQKLYTLLGKNSLPKTDRRATQRARRAAQIENLTEERVQNVVAEYLDMCAGRPAVEPVLQIADYHHIASPNESTAKAVESSILKFHENFVKSCLCKGQSKCDACQDLPAWKKSLPVVNNVTVPSHALVYDFCERCVSAYPYDVRPAGQLHPNHATEVGSAFTLPEMRIFHECCSPEEEQALMRMLNKRNWVAGQSGCFRQDYGPIVDYAGQRVTLDASSGLPQFIEYEVIKIGRRREGGVHETPFECASISVVELTADRMSAIQPRVENEWIWGDTLVLMALASDIIVTLSPISWDGSETYRVVRVRIPRRSQLALRGHVRHHWNYSLLSSDVHEKQILLLFRELSSLFRTGEEADTGRRIMKANAGFRGDVIATDGE